VGIRATPLISLLSSGPFPLVKLSAWNSGVARTPLSPFYSVQKVFARFTVSPDDLYAGASTTDCGFRFAWLDPRSTQKKVGHVRAAPPTCATHDEDFGTWLAHCFLVERECSAVEPLWPRPGVILEVETNPFEVVELLCSIFSYINDVRDSQDVEPFNMTTQGSLAPEG
jgi:hypothetical protein